MLLFGAYFFAAVCTKFFFSMGFPQLPDNLSPFWFSLENDSVGQIDLEQDLKMILKLPEMIADKH